MRPALAVALALASGGAARAAPARLYRIALVRAEIGPPADGRADWDPPQVPRTGPRQTCCEGAQVPDAPAPDVQVIVTQGARRFASRVHYDEAAPSLGEVAYLALAPSDKLAVEVVEVDGEESEPIGKTSFAVPAPGRSLSPLAFGQVKRLEIELKPVARGEESFVVGGAGSVDTPLYLFAGQAVRAEAAGSLCLGRACAGPEGPKPGSELARLAPELPVGQLSAEVAGESQPFAPAAAVRAPHDDYLVLSLVTSPAVRLDGSYRVTVAVEP